MNTYDPAASICYVHMARERDPYSIPLERGRRCTLLPADYANRSTRTRLAMRPGHSSTDL
jgi:hypothetical protein